MPSNNNFYLSLKIFPDLGVMAGERIVDIGDYSIGWIKGLAICSRNGAEYI